MPLNISLWFNVKDRIYKEDMKIKNRLVIVTKCEKNCRNVYQKDQVLQPMQRRSLKWNSGYKSQVQAL